MNAGYPPCDCPPLDAMGKRRPRCTDSCRRHAVTVQLATCRNRLQRLFKPAKRAAPAAQPAVRRQRGAGGSAGPSVPHDGQLDAVLQAAAQQAPAAALHELTDVLLLDNRRTVHSSSSSGALSDGRDRWLQGVWTQPETFTARAANMHSPDVFV